MQVSQDQADSVRRSLDRVRDNHGALSELFFRDLFCQAPELRSVVNDSATEDLGAMVIKAVAIAVDDFESFDALRPTIERLGSTLRKSGVDSAAFDLAAEAFIRAVAASTKDGLDDSARTDWRSVLGPMIAALKAGAGLGIAEEREGQHKVTVFKVETGRSQSGDGEPSTTRSGRGSSKEFPTGRPSLVATSTSEAAARQTAANETTDEEIDAELGEAGKESEANKVVLERNQLAPIDVPRTVTIQYVGDGSGRGTPLQTILDVSLGNGIAHTHVCGGVAKCSTCRIRILDGVENCLPRNGAEKKIAEAKEFPAELRLACQTRIVGPVTVRRLVRDAVDARAAAGKQVERVGREVPLAVMFADIRGFTRFSEANFAYDVVHALNRYFDVIGKAIDSNHGHIDKYIGDGVMALFGLEPQRSLTACSDAVNAALSAIENLDSVNKYLSVELNEQFQIAIGINYGDVIVGEIGYADRRQFTAIGDAVNTAARLEAEAKARDATLLISESTWRSLPDSTKALGRQVRLKLRGKRDTAVAYDMSPDQVGQNSDCS
ncbi:MAG: adenylate/guanylate cyclase domain-containing protein [Hyphomicrobiaceae bacterium]